MLAAEFLLGVFVCSLDGPLERLGLRETFHSAEWRFGLFRHERGGQSMAESDGIGGLFIVRGVNSDIPRAYRQPSTLPCSPSKVRM